MALEPLRDYSLDDGDAVTAPPPYSSSDPEQTISPNTSQPGRGELFLHAVQWNCLRCIQPGYLAIYSMVINHDHRSWPAMYYFGHDQEQPTRLGMWHWIKIISTDILPLGLQGLMIYMGTTNFDNDGKLLPGWWVMGLMPPAVTGLYIIGLSMLPRVPGLKTTVFWGVVFHALMATAIIVPTAHTAKSLGTYKVPSTFAGIIAFQWFLMLSPMAMYTCPGPAIHLVFVLLATVLRGVPLATAMGGSSQDFPFCFDNLVALPIAFGLTQCGGIFILACFSSLRCERNRLSISPQARLQASEPLSASNLGSQERLANPENQRLEIFHGKPSSPKAVASPSTYAAL